MPVGPTSNNINLVGQDGLTVFKSSTSTETITTRGVGVNNMFLGQSAGNATLSGGSNIGLGAGSSSSLTTGTGNIGLGVGALTSNQTGNSNIAIGSNALSLNVSSYESVAIGDNALAISMAGDNTAIGTSVGAKLTTGFGLTGVGWNALANCTGSTNTAVGWSSASFLTSGVNNSFFGQATCRSLTTGSTNLILGSLSGANYTSSESNNILLMNNGVVGENNVMRLGTQYNGSGTGQIIQTYLAGVLNTLSGQVVKTTIPGAYPYTTLITDYVILVNTSTARTINLIASPVTGTTYRIKDATGSGATNNITITPNSGNIDGSGTFVINSNYASVDVVYSGTQWNIL